MSIEQAAKDVLWFKNFHRSFPPGVVDWRSIDGPYNIAKLVPTGSVMLELGVDWGESAFFWANCGQFSKITLVDPYIGDDSRYQFVMDGVVIPHEGTVSLLRMKSMDAMALIPEGTLDLVYIDAVHDYENVHQEILASLPKMKKGGIVAGHDYGKLFPDMNRAIDEIFGKPDRVFTDTSWMKRV